MTLPRTLEDRRLAVTRGGLSEAGPRLELTPGGRRLLEDLDGYDREFAPGRGGV